MVFLYVVFFMCATLLFHYTVIPFILLYDHGPPVD